MVEMMEMPVPERPALMSDSWRPTTVVIKPNMADPIDLVKLVSPPKVEYSKKRSFAEENPITVQSEANH